MGFSLLEEIQSAARSLVGPQELISSFFNTYPEVESLLLVKTNEYDDNNYSDSISVKAINGLSFDEYEFGYTDDDGDQLNLENASEAIKTKVVSEEAMDSAIRLASHIIDDMDYDDNVLLKKDYPLTPINTTNNSAFYILMQIYHKNPDPKILETILSWENNWNKFKFVCLYAEQFGRFSPEIEVNIFCNTESDSMSYVLAYARTIKAKVTDKVLQYYMLKDMGSTESDEYLQKYVTYIKGLV